MDAVATWLGYAKPTKKEQLSKCRRMTNDEIARINREIRALNRLKDPLKKDMQRAEIRTRKPARRTQAHKDVRFYKDEIELLDKKIADLTTVKESLHSIVRNIGFAGAGLTATNAIRTASIVEKEANKKGRIDLALLQRVSTVYTEELMRYEIMDELVEEAMAGVTEDAGTEVADTEDAEVMKTIDEILNPKSSTSKVRTPAPVAQEPVVEAPQEKLDEEKQDEGETAEALMEDMNHRLQALRS